jgi:hypothetical protein
MAATILVIMAWLSRDLAAPNPPTEAKRHLLSGSKAYVRHGAAGVHCMQSPNIELVINLNEPPRVHHACRRRGGVAGRGARAAAKPCPKMD